MERVIHYEEIVAAVCELCIKANCEIRDDVTAALEKARAAEESPLGRSMLERILQNNRIAREEDVAACQDTGTAVVFVSLGQDVRLAGGYVGDAIEEGVRQGYRKGYLRTSVVGDPIARRNTGDNTPAVIHWDVVPGDQLVVTVVPKGGGAENMSRLAMLAPSEGIEGVKDFVVRTVSEAGSNPCPPVVVGLGIGGNFETCPLAAKRALLRPLGQPHPDPFWAGVEEEILRRVNQLGIGPQGFGGRITALAVHIKALPCHIASLPVAVNLNCHSLRHESARL